MTWAAVRAQVVSVVEAVTPPSSIRSAIARGRSQRFRFTSTATEESLPDSRGFWLRLDTLAVSGSTPRGVAYRQRDEVTLSVAYRRDVDAQDLDDAIASDYAAITRALADPAQWSALSSTIIAIAPTRADRYLAARVDTVEGARILRIAIEVEHKV